MQLSCMLLRAFCFCLQRQYAAEFRIVNLHGKLINAAQHAMAAAGSARSAPLVTYIATRQLSQFNLLLNAMHGHLKPGSPLNSSHLLELRERCHRRDGEACLGVLDRTSETCTDRSSVRSRDLAPPVPQGVRAAAGSACAVQGGQPRQPAGLQALE